ncbi:MAG: phosphoribosylglycinamide formyltransferase [Candidatus Caldatribacteriota bacterium]|jgi:phosphoribosylglycinamide formyltransferase-1|nr:phosphoribosylglycinamide formyltransferase [Atribacterota bacterium]MDD3031382.1 phosphoribosylglycinamide formyltransferase [Atribacterota bacterium]MDD4289631.1 phosphoribosylglycinamide formyltransferase [Atribacterota bacterium]MDD4765237.1 phosphoribosylglycinamide formyltransferase [Atribacterota bacterium]MDI9597664.1 phosphoribosylglycinamide formyltransferase [Atribacterota bacterium]
MINIAVLASGRGTNLQAIINAVQEGKIDGTIKIVISDNEKAYALKRARDNRINTMVFPYKSYKNKENYEDQIINCLKNNYIDLVVLAGYMRLLGSKIINNYRYRIINIHPALLPSFPGLNAQKQALEYGVKISGCTVHFVDEGIDTGPIILQHAVEVKQTDNEETLSDRILKYEHQLLPRAIQLFAKKRITIEKNIAHIT